MVDQVHRKALAGNPEDRKDTLRKLGDSFAFLPDKNSAWQDLHRLTRDDDRDM